MKTHALLIALVAFGLWFAPSSAFCQTSSANIQDARNGGVAIKMAAVKVTAAYTAKVTDKLILADTTAAAITVTLPPVEHGRLYTLQNIGTGTYALTVAAASGQTINGSSSYSVVGNYQSITIQGYKQGDARAWYVVSGQDTPRVQAVTATTGGDTTGVILPGTSLAIVTSSVNTKLVTLPPPVVGRELDVFVETTGFKLQTSAPASIYLNAITLGASAGSTIAAGKLVRLRCVTPTLWRASYVGTDGTIAALPST
jgi:hypothetical protein